MHRQNLLWKYKNHKINNNWTNGSCTIQFNYNYKMLIIAKCRDSNNNFGYVYAFRKRNERLIVVKKFNCSMVLLLLVSGGKARQGPNRHIPLQVSPFLVCHWSQWLNLVKVRVKYGEGKKEHEFSFMCIIISDGWTFILLDTGLCYSL